MDTRGWKLRRGAEAGEAPQPIKLKNGIAILDPEPIARGAFGEIYTGHIANPIGLLAERVVHGEENPRWLGLDDIPFSERDPDPQKGKDWLPQPILDAALRQKVYEAGTRLWNEYIGRRLQDRARAQEEFQDIMGLLDPKLLEENVIAVKVLVPPMEQDRDLQARMADESLRRFIKENDMLRGLRHPGIVNRLGLVEDEALGWCLLLEFIDGETLEEHLKKHPGRRLPISVAVKRIGEVAEAIEYAHGHGVIHRDLKPSNIMVRADDGRAIIMDFGIGKWSHESHTQQFTLPGTRIGTPRYMAPEQVRPDGVISCATDVYQLSTVLFEMVSGHAAYEGMEQTMIFHSLAAREGPHPMYVAEHVPWISPDLETLIEVGREKDADKRWTIEEFRRRLADIVALGRYDGRDTRRPSSAEGLREALRETRMRRKESHWEEKQLETRIHFMDIEGRIAKIKVRMEAQAFEDAANLLAETSKELDLLPSRYAPLKEEVQGLMKSVEVGVAKRETTRLLSLVEEDFTARRFSDVGERLVATAYRLNSLPEQECPAERERFKTLSERYDTEHRSLVDLFNTLRRSFVMKVQEEYADLQLQYGQNKPIELDRLTELLKKVTMAVSNLKILDRDKVGPDAWDRAMKDLEEQRIALEDLLKRVGRV